MNVFEIRLKVKLNKCDCTDGIKATRDLVNTIIVKSLGEEFHKANKYKYYVFDGLQEFPSPNKEGSINNFRIRTTEAAIVNSVIKNAIRISTAELTVVDVDFVVIGTGTIDKVYTLTPVILKFKEGYWVGTQSLDIVLDRIKVNLIKKYNKYNNAKLKEDFELFEGIEVKNKYPITIKYKNITLLGDKFELRVAKNPIAQELIYFALATGLGEMNAEGFGFIVPTWI